MSGHALDIVIVSFNSREILDACLRSLASQVWQTASGDSRAQGDPASAAPDRRIIVVDNASTDGTAAHLRTHWPRVALIASEANRGFAAANNLAIRASTAPLV